MQELLFLFFLALAYRFRPSFVKVISHPSLRVLTEDLIPLIKRKSNKNQASAKLRAMRSAQRELSSQDGLRKALPLEGLILQLADKMEKDCTGT